MDFLYSVSSVSAALETLERGPAAALLNLSGAAKNISHATETF